MFYRAGGMAEAEGAGAKWALDALLWASPLMKVGFWNHCGKSEPPPTHTHIHTHTHTQHPLLSVYTWNVIKLSKLPPLLCTSVSPLTLLSRTLINPLLFAVVFSGGCWSIIFPSLLWVPRDKANKSPPSLWSVRCPLRKCTQRMSNGHKWMWLLWQMAVYGDLQRN